MARYQCRGCPYIYDPAVGDRQQGIPPGTKFEDLADNWACPECSTPKSMFDKL